MYKALSTPHFTGECLFLVNMVMIILRPITANHGNYDRHQAAQKVPGVLKPGQIIDAVTLNNSSHGHVSLRIGTAVIKASTNITLPQNAHLQLEIVQTQPQLLLRLIPSSIEAAISRPLQEAMINLLPRQSGLASALAEIIHRMMTKADTPGQQAMRTLANTLINTLPTRNTLINAEALRQAIFQSGLFLEASLPRFSGANSGRLSRDLKACLLRARHGLAEEISGFSSNHAISDKVVSEPPEIASPPRSMDLPSVMPRVMLGTQTNAEDTDLISADLYHKIQGAIARLGLLQVVTAENFNKGEYMWQLEIPVRQADAVETVSMTIEKEQNDTLHEDNTSWVVNLAMDLPRLGAIQIRISLYKQGISTHFWSDSPDITESD